MMKRVMLGTFSMMLFIFANIRLCWRAEMDGQQLDGTFTRAQVQTAYSTAQAVLCEISGGAGECPQPKLRATLAFSPTGDISDLTDLILSHTYGVEKLCAVYADGMFLGRVSDEGVLRESLRSFVYDQMPLCAVSGEYSKPYSLETVYTARSYVTSINDMVLLISGKAPVFYYTNEGKRA